MQSRPEENDDDGERSDDYPYRVAASVAGLGVANGVAESGGAVGDAVDGAVDGFDVDDFPKDIFGEPDQRTNDGRGVEFVHVIFVEQRFVNGLQGFGELLGLAGLLQIEPEGGEQADGRGNDGDHGQREFKRVRGGFAHAGSFMSAENRNEEFAEMIGAAPQSWCSDPSADDGKNGEDDQRTEHVPRRFVDVDMMF